MNTSWQDRRREYEVARAEVQYYYKQIDRAGFSYGYNSFPPFLRVNGKVDGPLAMFMDDCAADLGVQVNPVQCTWDDFAERLAVGDYVTVAAPVMPIHLRAFSIIVLVELHCGALFFSRSLGKRVVTELRHYIGQIRTAFRELAKSESPIESSQMHGIEILVRAVANASNSGLAAGRQYLEHTLLQRLNAPIKRELQGPVLAMEAQHAADEGFLCVIDLVTLRLIEDEIGGSEFSKRYEYLPLLGDWLCIDAGLPFINADVGTYLHHRWRYDEDGSRSRVLQKLEEAGSKHVTQPGFRIIEPQALPEGMAYPGIQSTRDSRYYQGLAALLFGSTRSVASASMGAVPASSMLSTAPLPRALLPPSGELGEALGAINEVRGGGAFEAVRMSLREIAPAQEYVIERYHDIIDRKYLGGLTTAEEEELTRLEVVLDEMDEPFYEKILRRLRALRDEEVG
jgi:hypothetical protein